MFRAIRLSVAEGSSRSRRVWNWLPLACVACLACGLSVGVAGAEELRTWKDASGKFAIEATLVKIVNGKVYLKAKGGRDLIIASEKLCEADQNFLGISAPNPFELADGTKEFVSPLVVVRVSDGKSDYLLPGIVHCVRDGQAFVVVDTLTFNFRGPNGKWGPDVPLKFSAAWDAGGERQKAELEEVLLADRLSKWILRGPAKSLPAPLTSYSTAIPAARSKVELIECTIDFNAKTFALSQASAAIDDIIKQADGSISAFSLHTSSQNRNPQGLVINDKRAILGVLHSARFAQPARAPFFWEEPTFFRIHVFPIAGDAEKITWQVGVEYVDPLQKQRECTLLVRRDAYAQDRHRSSTNERSKSTLRAGDPGVLEFKLKTGTMSATALAYLPAIGADPAFPMLVGQWEEKHPGAKNIHEFDAQVSFLAADGKTIKSEPCTIVRFGRSVLQHSKIGNFEFPNIPGIDGTALDQPQLKKVPRGYQLTSQLTVPKVQFKSDLPADVPQHGKSDEQITGPVSQHGKMESMQLSLGNKDPKSKGYLSRQMAISPDGNFFYLFDRENALHKIDAQTLKIVATVSLPGHSSGLMFSKAGLMAILKYPTELWHLDPDTLAVRKVYIIPNILAMDVSLGSNLGFLVVKVLPSQTEAYHLHMLDLEAGKLLHSLPMNRESFKTPQGGGLFQVVHVDERDNLTFTEDGKYLFLSTRHEMMRFGIDNSEVIFEEQFNGKGDTMRIIACNADGKQVVAQYRYNAPLFLANGLKLNDVNVPSIESRLPASARAYNFKTGNLFELGKSELIVTSKSGDQVAQATIDGSEDWSAIQLFPQGDRFITYSPKSYYIHDLKPGRLKAK